MSLFLGPMRQHIRGKKELTEKSELLHLMPKKEVYIPLVAGRTLDFDILVEEGDTVSVGTKLAETKSGFYVPIYSSVSGTYKGIVKRMHNSMRPQNHMVIECNFKQTKVQSFAPLDWQSATRQECVDFVKNAGIVGLGGAGFPTYVKYMKPDGVDYVLINAVECEPYITADYRSVMDDAKDLVTGAKIMKKMAEAKTVYICIKESHPDLIEKVKSVVPGGETGQLSIYNGLKSAKQIAKDEKSIVLIHDGVRPLINEKVISDNIQSVIKYGSAITTAKVKETILVVNEGTATIDYVPSRNNSRVAKAPQSFWLDDILKAHEKALSEGEKNCIDSCTMMQRYGYDLYLMVDVCNHSLTYSLAGHTNHMSPDD